MRILSYLVLLLMFSVASAQTPTILQGDYISNVFGNSNFILNPNAQTSNCTTSGTITCANVTVTNASITRVTTTPLVARTEFNVAIGTANGTATWATRAFDAGMKGQNCEARFTYRGFAATSKVHIKQGANTVATLNLTPATDPRIASINFPCGDLSTATTFVVTDTAILAGTNEIGAIYTGLATNMANVAQASKVGGFDNMICSGEPALTAGALNSFLAPNVAGTCTGTAVGLASAASSNLNTLTLAFNNLPPGEYVLLAPAYVYPSSVSAGSARCDGRIRETTLNLIDGANAFSRASTVEFVSIGAINQFKFQNPTTGNRIFQIEFNRFLSTSNCSGGFLNVPQNVSLYRFPTSSELVVTPERQNTYGYISGTGLDYSTKSATYVTPSGFTMDPGYGKCVADGTNIACKIETLPPGSYDVTVNAPFFAAGGSSGNQSCYWGISDGIQIDVATGQTLTPVTAGTYDGISAVSRQFTYASVRSNIIFKLIVKELSSGGASANCSIATSNSRYWAMKVTPLNQPSNSALYVEGPVKASATGAAIPAGYVGEVKHSATSPGCGTVSQYNDGASVALGVGVWRINSQAVLGLTSAASVTNWIVFTSPSTGNVSTWRDSDFNDYSANTITFASLPGIPMTLIVKYDGTNLSFFKNGSFTGSTASVSGNVYVKYFRNGGTCGAVTTSILAERIN